MYQSNGAVGVGSRLVLTSSLSLFSLLKVVSKRDIEGFFEDMETRKKRRLNSGEGVPPAHCHF